METTVTERSEGVLVRFVAGKVPLSTAFFLVYAPVYLMLIVGARQIGTWIGKISRESEIPVDFFLVLLVGIALVVAIGTVASAVRARNPLANAAMGIVGFVSGAYLYGWVKYFLGI